MNKLLYLLVLVGAVSLTAYISASGEVHNEGFAGECIPVSVVPSGTPDVTATSTAVDTPTATPDVRPTKKACNQGIGNLGENCDPGNSNHKQPSNDERGRRPGTPGPRGR